MQVRGWQMELLTLESPSAPELPEPHHRQDQGKAEEKILNRRASDAGANNRIWVIHDDRFSVIAKMGQPPICKKLEWKDD
mgnify:FL=1